MILLKVDDSIQFTPENDMDCFNLGGLSKELTSYVINIDRKTGEDTPYLMSVAIKESDLLTYIFRKS